MNSPESFLSLGEEEQYEVSTFEVKGNCYYPDYSPVDNVTVDIINLNSGEKWVAETDNNFYSLELEPKLNVTAGDTLRLIAKDENESVNVTDHLVEGSEINAGFVIIDLIIDIHYRDLKDFPLYLAESQGSYNIDQMTGAAVAQMTLNYLKWNTTAFPNEPPLQYDNQSWIFENATEYNYNTSLGFIDAYGMARLLIREVPNNEYGTFFGVSFHDTIPGALIRLCAWIDYPIGYYGGGWPVPGHPDHVPALVPTGGNYSHWIAVRGIHTNQNAWPPSEIDNLTVYGVWINDPLPEGMGKNTYKPTNEFFTSWLPLNVTGDIRNGTYVCVTEPPMGFNESIFEEDTVHIDSLSTKPSKATNKLVNLARSHKHKLPNIIESLVNAKIIRIARNAVHEVLQFDQDSKTLFDQCRPMNTIYVQSIVNDIDNYHIVLFSDGWTEFAVLLDANGLLEFSIDEGINYGSYFTTHTHALYQGGSLYYPTLIS
jgi:hypothetical protein